MAVFINEETKVVVQGLTGREGKFHALRNRDYGTKVVAGTRPGKGGEEVGRLKKEVAKLCNTNDIQLNINEVKRPELNAELVGQNIASQLVKKMAYRRVINKTMQSTMRMGAEGIRINVAGRLGGVEIARSERFMDGRVPLHTLRANIDYALVEAHTTYGIIGIKVWICNGFSKAKSK